MGFFSQISEFKLLKNELKSRNKEFQILCIHYLDNSGPLLILSVSNFANRVACFCFEGLRVDTKKHLSTLISKSSHNFII